MSIPANSDAAPTIGSLKEMREAIREIPKAKISESGGRKVTYNGSERSVHEVKEIFLSLLKSSDLTKKENRDYALIILKTLHEMDKDKDFKSNLTPMQQITLSIHQLAGKISHGSLDSLDQDFEKIVTKNLNKNENNPIAKRESFILIKKSRSAAVERYVNEEVKVINNMLSKIHGVEQKILGFRDPNAVPEISLEKETFEEINQDITIIQTSLNNSKKTIKGTKFEGLSTIDNKVAEKAMKSLDNFHNAYIRLEYFKRDVEEIEDDSTNGTQTSNETNPVKNHKDIDTDNQSDLEKYVNEKVEVINDMLSNIHGVDQKILGFAGTVPKISLENKTFDEIKDDIEIIQTSIENSMKTIKGAGGGGISTIDNKAAKKALKELENFHNAYIRLDHINRSAENREEDLVNDTQTQNKASLVENDYDINTDNQSDLEKYVNEEAEAINKMLLNIHGVEQKVFGFKGQGAVSKISLEKTFSEIDEDIKNIQTSLDNSRRTIKGAKDAGLSTIDNKVAEKAIQKLDSFHAALTRLHLNLDSDDR